MTTEPPAWPPVEGPSQGSTPPPYTPPIATPPPALPPAPTWPAGDFGPPPAPGATPFSAPAPVPGQPTFNAPPPFSAPPPYSAPAPSAPPFSAPQYGAAPQYGHAPQYGPPQYGPPQYGPPQFGPPQFGASPVAPAPGAPRSRRRSRVLISLGSVVTVGLVGLGAAAIAFGGGGASSPEEAVEQLAVAIDNEDVLAAVATLAPDETRSLPELYQQGVQKARELDDDSSNDDKDPSDGSDLWEGLDLKVEGLELKATNLSDDIAKVEIVAGTISYDVEKGSTARERFDSFYENWLPLGFGSYDDCEYLTPDDMDEIDPEVYDECVDGGPAAKTHGEFDFADVDDDDPGVFAMAVKRDGGWYLSPLFTIAEYSRIGLDSPEPVDYTIDPGPAAGNPTAAVEALAKGAEALDVKAIVDALSSELNVWRVYGKTFDDSELDDEISSLAIDDLELSEEPIDDDRVRVVVEKAHVTAVVNEVDYDSLDYDEYEDYDDEDLPTIEVTYESWLDGNCVTTTDDREGSEKETNCAADDGGLAEALGMDRFTLVAVIDRDGWAVSPIETIADYLRTLVSHLDKPLVDRMNLEFFSFGDEVDRESSGTLREGENDVELDSAGVAVVDVEVDDNTFMTVTSPDDGVSVRLPYDSDFSSVLSEGSHQVVITGPIGASSATVVLEPVEVTELPGLGADGSAPAPVTGEVEVGHAAAFTTTAANYRLLDIDLGYNLYSDDLDEDGDWVYVDEDTDDDEIITILVTNADYGEYDESDAGPDDNRYTFTYYPTTGGFSSPDRVNQSVALDEYGTYPTVGLAIVDGQPVDVTVTSPVDATVELYCASTNADGSLYDPNGDEDIFDENSDDYDYEDYPTFLTLQAGVPGTARITPGATEICDLDVYADDYLDDESSAPPVTMSVAPAAP